MSKVISDNRQVYPGLKKRNRAAVAKYVGSNATHPKFRHRFGCMLDMFFYQIRGPIPTER
jgi:hypothetical protein